MLRIPAGIIKLLERVANKMLSGSQNMKWFGHSPYFGFLQRYSLNNEGVDWPWTYVKKSTIYRSLYYTPPATLQLMVKKDPEQQKRINSFRIPQQPLTSLSWSLCSKGLSIEKSQYPFYGKYNHVNHQRLSNKQLRQYSPLRALLSFHLIDGITR